MGEGESTGPQVRLAARRMAHGQAIVPPPEIIFSILAEKYGMWPDDVASRPVEEVLAAWELHAEMQPKGK